MLTLDEVRSRIAAIVEKEPDAVRSCQYVRSGKPHCVVGVFLSELGVSMETLEYMDKDRMFIGQWQVPVDVTSLFDEDSRTFLGDLQRSQDGGSTWEAAFEYATNEMESYVG
jgi:hypothetical protein